MQPEVNTTPDASSAEEKEEGKAAEEAPTEPLVAEPAVAESADPGEQPEPERPAEEAPTEPSVAEPAVAESADSVAQPGPERPAEEAPTELSVAEPAAVPRADAGTLSVSGNLRQTRAGPVRVLCWVTGLALLGWLAQGLLLLLGHRHPATLTLAPRALDIVGQRRLMGIGIGSTRRLIPFASIQLVDLVARSAVWTLVAAIAALALLAGLGVTLLMWGVAGREPSWIVLGLSAIGAGILLDALAYLRVRRSAARGLADVEVRVRGARIRLCRVEQAAAQQLVDRIARGA